MIKLFVVSAFAPIAVVLYVVRGADNGDDDFLSVDSLTLMYNAESSSLPELGWIPPCDNSLAQAGQSMI